MLAELLTASTCGKHGRDREWMKPRADENQRRTRY
jgi:hypothetical protein